MPDGILNVTEWREQNATRLIGEFACAKFSSRIMPDGILDVTEWREQNAAYLIYQTVIIVIFSACRLNACGHF